MSTPSNKAVWGTQVLFQVPRTQLESRVLLLRTKAKQILKDSKLVLP